MFDSIPETDFSLSIDLDKTMLATQNHMKTLFDSKIMSNPELLHLRNRTYVIEIEDMGKPGSGINQKCWGILRPHARKFLAFCSRYFKSIAVFSAGTDEYVNLIVDYLFRDLPYPTIIFSRDKVDHDKYNNPIKLISKLTKESGGEMTLENTFHLDDIDSTYSKNPDNGINIPPYQPEYGLEEGKDEIIREENIEFLLENMSDDHDNALLTLQNWFMRPEVIYSKDVRELDKDYIFDDMEEL